jgi:hypothetical protein
MGRVGRWALIIGRKILETGGFGEDLRKSGVGRFLFGRNKIVPPVRKKSRKK